MDAMLIVLFLALVAVALASVHFGPHSSSLISGGALALSIVGLTIALGTSSSMTPGFIVALGIIACVISVGIGALGLAGLRALRRPSSGQATALSELHGACGLTKGTVGDVGTVVIEGETWSARSLGDPIPAGTAVLVTRTEGLTLLVVPDPLAHHPGGES